MKRYLTICLLFAMNFAFGFDIENAVPLKNIRSKIEFKTLSNDEKLSLIKITKQIFADVYVNLENKKTLYQIDPARDLDLLEKNYQDKTTDEFQANLMEIINKVQDRHVSYKFPAPYGCYTVSLPLTFHKINTGKIVVSSLLKSLPKISLGDELITYNNQTPTEALNARRSFIAASTNESRISNGIWDLSWRDLAYEVMPDTNREILTLKKQNGEIYKINLPWFATVDKNCLENINHHTSLGNVGFRGRIKPKLFSIFHKDNSYGINLNKLKKTRVPNVLWNLYKYKNKSIGLLKIDSFNEEYDYMIPEIQFLLTNELKNADSILIDVRGNPGGIILYAEWIATFFTPKSQYKMLPFYVRANSTTLKLTDDQEWIDLITANINSKSIVGPKAISWNLPNENYFQGKLAVLTDAECFSSCEIFTASMKDNAQAIIYGIEKTTFGGGANNLTNDNLEVGLNFKVPQGAEFSVTYRLAHRLSDNSVIDDVGIPSDIYLPKTMADILDPDHAPSMLKIFDDLAK